MGSSRPSKYLLGIILTISFVINLSKSQLTIESPSLPYPLEYNSDKLNFPQVQFISCVCIQGVWALRLSDLNQPSPWKILTGEKGSPKCYKVGAWVSHVRRISTLPIKSSLKSLKESSNTFIVMNEKSWEMNIIDRKTQHKYKICLPGTQMNAYCIYNIRPTPHPVPEKSFTHEHTCSPDSIQLHPTECSEFFPQIEVTDNEDLVCDLVPSSGILKRRKRQAQNDPTDANGNPITTTTATPGQQPVDDRNTTPLTPPEQLDEDYIEMGNMDRKGNETMMTAITDYIRLQVARILELSLDRGKRSVESEPIMKSHRYERAALESEINAEVSHRSKRAASTPVANLLRLSNDIMKKTCTPVNDDVFNVALESFIKLQKDIFHIKEPYIPYSSYVRILSALEKCSAWAQPHIFVPDTTNPEVIYCETAIPRQTSDKIKKNGQNQTILPFPKHAWATPEVHDPVIETVWKAFLSAHSYCYPFFQDYFNDHHTFTVALMPYFTNDIKNMWLVTPGVDPNNNYKQVSLWYGNLLGDVGVLFKSVDQCYGASRLYSDYPWYLKRPFYPAPTII